MFFINTKYLFLTGFFLSLLSLSWTVFLLPLSWVGFPGYIGFFVFFFLVLLLACVGGVSFLPFLLLNRFFGKDKYYLVTWVVFLFLVIVSELIKVILMWIIFYDNGFSFALSWNILSLGYFVAYNPFIIWAGPLHVYSLSICFGYIVFLIFLIYKREVNSFLILLFIFISATFYLHIHYPVADKIKQSQLKHVIVMPEGVSFFQKELKQLPKEDLYLEGGYEMLDETGTKYNVSNFFLAGKKEKIVYKEFLMPFGEYMPLLFKPIAKLYLDRGGSKKDYNFWRYMRFGYIEGHNDSRLYTMGGIKIATLLCSEILSSSVLKEIKLEKPDIVYLQGSYLNFNNSHYFNFFLSKWVSVAEQYLGVKIIVVKQGIN